MKRILVTGAAGFLGSNCLSVLQNTNLEIFALDKVTEQKRDPGINWIEADLSDSEQVEQLLDNIKPDYLLHLAWKMETGMQLNSNVNNTWVDISMDLIRKFARAGGKRVVVSGSCAEYKWGNYLYDEETTPLEPQSIYGQSKHKLHKKIAAFCSQNNVSYAWGRIFFMYGPNEDKKRLVPHVIHSILKDEKVQTTHGNQIYDYLYVQDVAEALTSLVDSDYNGAVNICSGKPVTLKDIILKIAARMNGEHLIEMGALETTNKAPEYVVGNNNRLKEITNWKQKTDMDTGIKKTIEFIKTKQFKA